MKVVTVYLVAFLVCGSIVTSNAESGKSIEKKRKFASMSNKARDDAVIECHSGKEILRKTLKSGEKIRWALQPENAGATICRLDLGGVHGHFSPFLAKYCKKECKWRVFADGMLNLNLGGGEWKSFDLQIDDLEAPTPAPAPAPAAAALLLKKGKKAPAPAPAAALLKKGKKAPPPLKNNDEWKSPAPAPPPSEIAYSPEINDETASEIANSPESNDETAPPPWENANSPEINDETAPPPSPVKAQRKSPAKSPTPAPLKNVETSPAPPPAKHTSRKFKHGNSSKPKHSPAPAPSIKITPREASPPAYHDAKRAPPPMETPPPTNHDAKRAPPPTETPPESVDDESEAPTPPAQPRSTFYSCIKEDSK